LAEERIVAVDKVATPRLCKQSPMPQVYGTYKAIDAVKYASSHIVQSKKQDTHKRELDIERLGLRERLMNFGTN
jgi:hypothetical protein